MLEHFFLCYRITLCVLVNIELFDEHNSLMNIIRLHITYVCLFQSLFPSLDNIIRPGLSKKK